MPKREKRAQWLLLYLLKGNADQDIGGATGSAVIGKVVLLSSPSHTLLLEDYVRVPWLHLELCELWWRAALKTPGYLFFLACNTQRLDIFAFGRQAHLQVRSTDALLNNAHTGVNATRVEPEAVKNLGRLTESI